MQETEKHKKWRTMWEKRKDMRIETIRGVCGVMAIVVGNGDADTSSNPGPG